MRERLALLSVLMCGSVTLLGSANSPAEATCIVCTGPAECGPIIGDGGAWCRISCSGGHCQCYYGGTCTDDGDGGPGKEPARATLGFGGVRPLESVSIALFAVEGVRSLEAITPGTVVRMQVEPAVEVMEAAVMSACGVSQGSLKLTHLTSKLQRSPQNTVLTSAAGDGHAVEVVSRPAGARVAIQPRTGGTPSVGSLEFDLLPNDVLLIPVNTRGRAYVMAIAAAVESEATGADGELVAMHRRLMWSARAYAKYGEDGLGWRSE